MSQNDIKFDGASQYIHTRVFVYTYTYTRTYIHSLTKYYLLLRNAVVFSIMFYFIF